MDMILLREQAKGKLSPYCRVCKVCDGRLCAGEMPGLGGTGTGSSFIRNIQALDQYKVNLRTLHEAEDPQTMFNLFGYPLPAPIMAAPITAIGMQTNGQLQDTEWAQAVVNGSKEYKTIPWTGDGPDPLHFQSGIDALEKFKVPGIPIIKPRENKVIVEYIKKAEDAGAIAVGIDVDAAGIINMKLKGQPVGPKSGQDLFEIIKNANIPVILKGIMTPEEAEIAEQVGAAGIVVSNHGGRVLDHTPGTAEVLPEIAAQVGGRIQVFVDGGIRTGVDVLKMLALGADAVLIGRPLLIGAAGGGAQGVAYILNKLAVELKTAMILTGCPSLKDVSNKILRK